MRNAVGTLLLFLLLTISGTASLAGPLQDVWINTEEDKKKNTTFLLVNGGSEPVYAKVQYDKVCTSMSNTRKPIVREYYVRPGKPVRLAKTWSQTTCRREYRILDARYPGDPPR